MPLTREGHAEWRRRNRARRIDIDGRLVAAHLPPERHGTISASADHSCRCDTCRDAHTRRLVASQSKMRREHRAKRLLVNGRLVAPLPPEKHGTFRTYSHYGCRCEACSAAGRAVNKARRDRRREQR